MSRSSVLAKARTLQVVLRVGIALSVVAMLAARADFLLAQLPNARLLTVFPNGAVPAGSVDVTVAGSDLDQTTGLHFSHPGITATAKMGEPDKLLGHIKPIAGRFTVTVQKSVPPGLYELRAVGLYGITNPRVFVVGTRPEVLEGGDQSTPDKAQEIELGTTVNGRATAAALDYFKFSATKGQRILCDCVAQRVDSRLDASLVLYDAKGRELKRNRDHDRRDPFIDFTAPADGDYVLAVHDFLFAGGNEYFYRLSVHSGPHLDFILPSSGAPGSTNKYTVYGRNLPGGEPADGVSVDGNPLQRLVVDITLPAVEKGAQPDQSAIPFLVEPSGSAIALAEYRLHSDQGVSNALPIGFATVPVVMESQPNDEAGAAQKVSVPCEYVGQFYPRGDRDWLSFQAKKGDAYWIEVISHRMGLPSDPHLLVQKVKRDAKGQETVSNVTQIDDQGANIGGAEFNTATDDPGFRFQADEDAEYRIQVRDLYSDSRGDPRFVYRLAIRRQQPDFALVAIAASPFTVANQAPLSVGSALVRKGGTAPIKVLVFRRDGFAGAIQVSVEGLPDGVTCPVTTIKGNANTGQLILAAADDAATWAGPIHVVGKSELDGSDVVRTARGGGLVWGSANLGQQAVRPRVSRNITLAVTGKEAAPVLVQVGGGKTIETCLGANLQIPIKVTRRNDFKADLKFAPVGLPGQIKPKELTIKGDATDGSLEIALSDTKLPAGTYTFHLRSEGQFKYRRNPEAVKAAEEEKKQIEQLAAQLTEQVKRADAEKQATEKAAAEAPGAPAQQAKEAAAKASQELQAKVKLAEERKKAVEKRIADLIKAAEPKDVKVAVVSTPLRLRVSATPIDFSIASEATTLKQGDKTEITVSVKRLYGFTDPVEVVLEVPKEVKGLESQKVTIPKGQSSAKLQVTAAKDAAPGEYSATVRASLKFNKVSLQTTGRITLKVQAGQ